MNYPSNSSNNNEMLVFGSTRKRASLLSSKTDFHAFSISSNRTGSPASPSSSNNVAKSKPGVDTSLSAAKDQDLCSLTASFESTSLEKDLRNKGPTFGIASTPSSACTEQEGRYRWPSIDSGKSTSARFRVEIGSESAYHSASNTPTESGNPHDENFDNDSGEEMASESDDNPDLDGKFIPTNDSGSDGKSEPDDKSVHIDISGSDDEPMARTHSTWS